MHELPILIYDLALMLGVAGIVIVVFQRIRQPVVLGYLIAGMILGPYTPPHALVNDIPNIKILSELGVIFLMFSLGLEFSFQKLTRVGFTASITGLIEVVFMALFGYIVGMLLGWSYNDAIFLGAALSISSTTIIIKAIDELKLKTKRFAEIIFGILIVEDLLAILLLVILSTIVTAKNVFAYDMLIAALKLVLVVGSWFLIGYFVVPPLFKKIAQYINQETLTIISVALCLFLVSVATRFHYSAALGAFIMGSILAETILIHRIEQLIMPIRDIFAAVFFISIGMLIDPVVIIQQWPIVLLLSLATVLGKIVITSVGSFLTGQSLTTSVRVGFGMAQIGEFSFIIIGLGLSLQAINDNLYPIIVAVSAITTFTTPYLIRASGKITKALDNVLPERIKYFLKSYSAWVYRMESASDKNTFLGTISARLILNGIVLAILFVLTDQFIYPELENFFNPDISNLICVFISIIISAPFIWGMLFAFKGTDMPSYAKSKVNPAISMIWLITLSEIGLLSVVLFHTWMTVLLFVLIGIVFFFVSYKQLEKSYQWFEQQLVENVTGESTYYHDKYRELAPWDTHMVEIEVGEHSSFAGKTLGECNVRNVFNVNVVAICHGARIIAAPRGKEMIASGDKLIVVGTDENIDAFRNRIEAETFIAAPPNLLDQFMLRVFSIGKHSLVIGKTIREINIREATNGIVVGLERDNMRILNPELDTILQVDDLLFVVGETDKIMDFEI